jgi:hypothetical protein
MSVRSNLCHGRLVAIGILLILLIVGYVMLLRHLRIWELAAERELGAKGVAGPMAQIYIEPVSIDALNHAMQIRVSVAPSGLFYGEPLAPVERPLRLMIAHDKAVEEIKVEANSRPPTASFEIDLNGGSVADYPLDAYHADLRDCSRMQFLRLTRRSRWLLR